VADSRGCVFCDALHESDTTSLVLHRGRAAFVILNLYPYNSGHLMVVPGRHVATLGLLSAEERCELMDLVQLSEQALTEAYKPQGLNVGMNLGRAAGAGIIDHLHIHVLPRWNGDTNFMSVVGGVRVMPEGLRQAVDRLRPVFRQLTSQKTEDRSQKTE
jgi:ATP adenylyltransferase